MSEEPTTSDSAEAAGMGYGRPPVSTRFQKGVSGNPRGRPKGSRNVASALSAALSERVTITENGRRKRITKLEAALKQLVNRAASGDLRSTQVLIALAQATEAKAPMEQVDHPKRADLEVMRELQRRLLESGHD
jgi:hypothetical protein